MFYLICNIITSTPDTTSSDNTTDVAFLKVKPLNFLGIFALCNNSKWYFYVYTSSSSHSITTGICNLKYTVPTIQWKKKWQCLFGSDKIKTPVNNTEASKYVVENPCKFAVTKMCHYMFNKHDTGCIQMQEYFRL